MHWFKGFEAKVRIITVVCAALLIITGIAAVPDRKEDVVRLDFEEVYRLGDNPAREEEYFYRVYNFLVDGERRLYVGDSGNSRIEAFDPTGDFLFSFGSQGQGPGEFQRLTKMVFMRNGNIVIHDQMSRKFIYMTRKGDHIKDDYYGDRFDQEVFYPHYFSNGELFFCLKNREDDLANIHCSFRAENPETHNVRNLFSCIEKWNVLRDAAGHVAVGAINYIMRVAVSPNDEIYLVNSGEYKVEVYSRDGRHLRTLTRTYKRVERPEKERNTPRAADGDRYLYPPRYYDDIRAIHFPLPDQCWVLPSRQIDGKNALDVFDDTGRFLRQVVLNVPAGTMIDFFLDEEHNQLYLYQKELTVDDEEMVVCYRGEIPGEIR